jgi:flavin reductase (DIM6/NTAB) family NADH-FMN oxidoreductase RutF
MSKVKMGPQHLPYPNPAVLIGANVDGKPSFQPVGWVSMACWAPPAISISVNRARYTLKGIRQNMTFSVNVPSIDLMKETDYCGLVSGSDTDKVKDCGFKIFYGNLDSAPLIEQCPVNVECEVIQILNLGSSALVVGSVVETHVLENCLTDGKPDIMKMNPMLFIAAKYYAIGEFLANGFSIGEGLKRKS